MNIRTILAAVLGLAFLVPAAPVMAQVAGQHPQFAQADKKGEDEAEQKKQRGRDRDDARGKGPDRGSEQSKDAGSDAAKDADAARRGAAEKARAEAEAKMKAAREAAAKAKAEQEAKSAADAAARAKADAEAKTKAEQEAKSAADAAARAKAAAEAKAKAEQESKSAADAAARAKADAEAKARADQEARSRAARDAEAKARDEQEAKGRAARAEQEEKSRAKRDAEAKAKASREAEERAKVDARAKGEAESKTRAAPQQQTAPEQQKQLAPQQQQTQERDRDDRRERFSRERRRDSEEERELRERAQQREQQRTPAQDLSKIQVQQGRATQIDGGRRTLERDGNRVVIRTDETSRFVVRGDRRGNERTERLPNGHTRTIVVYPDGTQIITIVDARGRTVHRSRRGRDGREIVFFREVQRPPLVQVDLGPLQVRIPQHQYIVDSRRASPADYRRVLLAPPVERVTRVYTIDEVRRFERVRNIMPRLDFHTITFDTDSALISPQQVDLLADLADIIHEMIQRNPAEVILIEGHTDLVGSDIYNLALSERRAEAVAIALTDYFDVPPENLVTQGYGESFPKIQTEAAERENRRVAFRRVTPLVSEYGR